MTLLTSHDMEKIFKKVYNWDNYECEKDIFEPERELITETELATIRAICRWVRRKAWKCRTTTTEGISMEYTLTEKDLKELEEKQ